MTPPTWADLLFSKIGNVKELKPGCEWETLCPVHEADGGKHRPSLVLTLFTDMPERIVFCCRAGCSKEAVMGALGLKQSDLLRPKPADYTPPRSNTHKQHIVNTYPYVDEAGKLLYEVVRYEPKDFRQRRPDSNGGYIWNLKGVRHVLYRLPEVLAAIQRNELVFLPEGEKDVDNLRKLGLSATTCAMGGGKWRREHSEQLRGARLVILPDNDPTGALDRDTKGAALSDIASSVRILELPGLPPKGDVSDWIANGGTKEELLRLADLAPIWTPPSGHVETSVVEPIDGLPVIETNNKQLRDVSDAAVTALIAANNPPKVFVRGGELVRIHADERDMPAARSLTIDSLRGILTRCADWVSTSEKRGTVNVIPPTSVVADVLALPGWELPGLSGIVTAPVFAADSSLCDQPGYHAPSKLFYHGNPPLELPNTTPTKANVDEALRLLRKDLLGGFPFLDAASEAHALGLLLLPYVRNMIDGQTPLHIIDAPSPGTGKGLLADACTLPFQPQGLAIMTAPNSEEEWAKQLTATLMTAPSHILIDNARVLNSSNLDAVLTAPVWTGRKLGHSETATIPVKAVWIATTNNAVVQGDLPRRTLWIRLDANCERPSERTDFAIPNLRSWIRENRARIVAAALTLVRAWIEAGSPCYAGPQPRRGSYEQWTDIIGGILDVVGVHGFLENTQAAYEQLDPRVMNWTGFFEAWHEKHGQKAVGVSDIMEIAQIWVYDELGDKGERSQQIKLGRLLGQAAGRFYGGYLLKKAGIEHKTVQYRVFPPKKGDVGDVGDVLPRTQESIRRANSDKDNTTSIRGSTHTQYTPHPPHALKEQIIYRLSSGMSLSVEMLHRELSGYPIEEIGAGLAELQEQGKILPTRDDKGREAYKFT